jgi:uracil phosphoribosyltransferase
LLLTALLTLYKGGSATLAVEVLKERGVPEHRILFLNLIASPSGVAEFAEKYPKLRVVTAFIDQGLDEKKYTTDHTQLFHRFNDTNDTHRYIVPGLGDFGDRYYTL